MLRPFESPERQLVAQSLIQDVLAWFGPVGPWVPGVALLLTLVIWQFMTRAPWTLRGSVPPLMLAESVLTALPLFVVHGVFAGLLLQAGDTDAPDVRSRLVIALGAAVYEELVFRLALVSLLTWVLIDLCRLPRVPALAVATIAAGVLFALAHVQPLGAEPFAWPAFLLRTVSGCYLSMLFLARGLGICTGAHATYNLVVAGLGG